MKILQKLLNFVQFGKEIAKLYKIQQKSRNEVVKRGQKHLKTKFHKNYKNIIFINGNLQYFF